jgi:hypothetical protein
LRKRMVARCSWMSWAGWLCQRRWAKRQGRPHLGMLGKLLKARLGLVEGTLGGLYTRLFGQVEEMLDEVAAGRLTLMDLGHQRSGFLAWSLARGEPAPNQAGP